MINARKHPALACSMEACALPMIGRPAAISIGRYGVTRSIRARLDVRSPGSGVF